MLVLTHNSVLKTLSANVGKPGFVRGSNCGKLDKPQNKSTLDEHSVVKSRQLLFNYIVIGFNKDLNLKPLTSLLDELGGQYALYSAKGPVYHHSYSSEHRYLVLPLMVLVPHTKLDEMTNVVINQIIQFTQQYYADQLSTIKGIFDARLQNVKSHLPLPFPSDKNHLIMHSTGGRVQCGLREWTQWLKTQYPDTSTDASIFDDILKLPISTHTKYPKYVTELQQLHYKLRKFLISTVVRLTDFSVRDDIVNHLIALVSNSDDTVKTYCQTVVQLTNQTILSGTIKHHKILAISRALHPEWYQTKDLTFDDYVKRQLGDDFEVNSKFSPIELATLLKKAFTFVRPKSTNKKSQTGHVTNLLVWDYETGIWVPADELLSRAVIVLKPTASIRNLQQTEHAIHNSIKSTVFDTIKQSRYQLFRNGMVDRFHRDQGIIPLQDLRVKAMHFTALSLINRDFKYVTEAPIYQNAANDGSDWSLDKLINSLANNDPQKIMLYWFFTSFGLIPTWSSGSSVLMDGPSGVGKSTLSLMLQAVYNDPDRVLTKTFNGINEPFGFTNLTPDTSVVSLSEANVGSNTVLGPGIKTYDQFSDATATFNIKNKGDIKFSIPPQLYIEGTGLVQFANTDTGPYRRSWVYHLHAASKDTQQSIFTSDLLSKLEDDDTAMYIYNKAMDVFNYVTNNNKLDMVTSPSTINNLKLKDWAFVSEWHDDLTVADSGITSFMDNWVTPYITLAPDDNHLEGATKLHFDLLHNVFYDDCYHKTHTNDKFGQRMLGPDRFHDELKSYFDFKNWHIKFIGSISGHNKQARFQVSSINSLNFNFSQFNDDYYNGEPMPQFRGPDKVYPLGCRIAGWFVLVQN